MNSIQLMIILLVVLLIVFTIGYYWYQEVKFKRMVENNFNQAAADVITDNNRALVLDGDKASSKAVNLKDIDGDLFADKEKPKHETKHIDNLFNNEIENKVTDTMPQKPVIDVPEDSVEAWFIKFDNVAFTFKDEAHSDLDFIIDVVFEETKKIKVVPDIRQFTHKPFKFYVLNKDASWEVFEKGNKYAAQGLKLVVELVDREGIISQAQLSNIYNEIYKFVLNNDGHIRSSDYEASISKIQHQIRHLNNIELALDLYLVIKNKIAYSELSRFFIQNNLRELDGKFILTNEVHTVFSISADSDFKLEPGNEYDLLKISTNLHLNPDPLSVADAIFDFSEKFMQSFESRLLTTHKEIFAKRDYDALIRYLNNYVAIANKNGMELGGILLQRLF